uniref:Uncharacterized protein n=1 Tax=Amphimedon queenslandica TaxID=400682 RepID=A0A1X7UC40_AMPQE
YMYTCLYTCVHVYKGMNMYQKM